MKINFINIKMIDSIKKQLGIILLAASSCYVTSLVILPQLAKAEQVTSPDGTTCDGNVQNGKLNGQGVCKYPDGASYEGNFVDGKPDGQGTYTFADGGRYQGDFRDGEFNGTGVWEFANGDRYEGEVQNGKLDGQGNLI